MLPEYINNSQNSTIRQQSNFKMGNRFNSHITKENIRMSNNVIFVFVSVFLCGLFVCLFVCFVFILVDFEFEFGCLEEYFTLFGRKLNLENQCPRVMCAANSLPDLSMLYMKSEQVRQLIVNSFMFPVFNYFFNLKIKWKNVYFDELG